MNYCLHFRSLLPFQLLLCYQTVGFSGVSFWHLHLLCPATQEGRELSLEKPDLKALVSEKLADLHHRWDELETTTQAKARSLFDANRAELFAQSCSALESWLESLQAQLHSDDYGKDLTSVNILLKKQQVHCGPLVGRVNSITSMCHWHQNFQRCVPGRAKSGSRSQW